MEQSSEAGSNAIHVVEIPLQIKEEDFFKNEANSLPDLQSEPGKFCNQCCFFSCNFNLTIKEKKNGSLKRKLKEKLAAKDFFAVLLNIRDKFTNPQMVQPTAIEGNQEKCRVNRQNIKKL